MGRERGPREPREPMALRQGCIGMGSWGMGSPTAAAVQGKGRGEKNQDASMVFADRDL